MRQLLIILCAAAALNAAKVKDLSPAVFSGLSKVYSGVPFQSRLKIKALTEELNAMGAEAEKDLMLVRSRHADTLGNILPGHLQKVLEEMAPIKVNTLPLKVKIPIHILLPVARIDSLHLTLEEDVALTPFVQVDQDTAKAK